ncbi:NAD(P)-dependent alcohol dehydrogenase [Cellulomonas sp. McL0617]|uniref:NAD(P)-dependent alcohol dehydrogenase n=1 Tax=Cellulomonas sp. McL0617 TaxID=3415675 RepID=UPI003CF3A7F9
MSAIVQHAYGTADSWALDQVDRPVIKPTEVLVRVHAAGLDRGTWHLMAGLPYAMRLGLGFRGPKATVPGRDLSGVVEATGAEVTRFQVGDEVFGTGSGAYAQLAAVSEAKLSLKPSNLTFELAAALPISGSTALRAVVDVGQVEAGQKVLVIGASGGVGTFAVQIAATRGAEVTGVCSAGKADLVRSLGATHVLDYTRTDFLDGRTQYDVIIDLAGNNSLGRLRGALTAHGTLVLVGGEDGDSVTGGMGRQLRALAVSSVSHQRLALVLIKEHFTVLDRVADLAQNSTITPAVERTYPLAEAAIAMRHLEAGQVRGKLVITL